MSNPIRLLIHNHFEQAVLTAGPGTTFENKLPIDNLKKPQRSRIARSTTSASVVINGTLPEVKIFTACVLWRHNLPASARWKVELFSDADQQGTLTDLGWMDALELKGWGEFNWGVDDWGETVFEDRPVKFSAKWFTAVAARSFRITIEAPDIAYVDVTKIYFGQHIEPSANVSWGHSVGWVDTSSTRRTAGGTIVGRPRDPNRQLQFSLDYLSETDRPVFMEMDRKIGKTKDIFISVYPEQGGQLEIDYSFAGKFTEITPLKRPRKNHFSKSYRIEEQ